MNIDILRFLAFPDAASGAKYSRQNDARGMFKGDASDIITPVDASTFGQWKHIKNPQGWPWDLSLYDSQFVYAWITEGKNGWSSDPNVGPKSFKKFIRNHLDKNNNLVDGLPLLPRSVDSVNNNFFKTFASEATTYATFEGCQQTGTFSLGPVTTILQGPFQVYHGGDVGTQPTLIHKYMYSDNGVPTTEQNMYVLDYGWVSWRLLRQNPTTGVYEVAKETIETLIFPAQPKIVFPCF